MILLGSVGLGNWYRRQVLEKVRVKKMWIHFLTLLMSEIRYGKATLPECCSHLAGHMDEPIAKGLQKLAEEYRIGEKTCFTELFYERMQGALKQYPLRDEEIRLLLRCFENKGFPDEEMQLKNLEQSIDYLNADIRQNEKLLKEKCDLAVGLGALGGLFLLVLLY